MNAEGQPRRPEQDATELGLAVIAEATANGSFDPELESAAEENLVETVDSLVDQPLTERQTEVVASLAGVSGSITAGLTEALAAQQNRPVEEILGTTAKALLVEQESEGREDERDHRDRDDNQA